MAEQEFGPKEVLSVLSQWELNLKQRENEGRAYQYIRQVIAAYQKMHGELGTLDTSKKLLERTINELQGKHDAIVAKHRQATVDHKDKCECDMLAMQERMDAVKQQLAALERDLQDKELFVSKRATQLDADIKVRTEALARVQKSFDSFIAEHKLGSA